MSPARSIGRRLRRLRLLMESEEGIALPVALFATVAAMALGGAAVMSSINVQHGTTRDNGSKSAIAAADSGANVALHRLNHYSSSLNGEQACLNLNSSGQLEPGGTPTGEPGWCAPIEGEVGGATYSYRVSAVGANCTATASVCIVSTGSVSEVSRRVELKLTENSVTAELTQQEIEELEEKEKQETLREEEIRKQKEREEEETQQQQQEQARAAVAGLIGREGITSSGNADIRVGVGTNGNLVTSGNTSICGDIRVGVGKKWTKSGNASQCSGYTFTEGTTELPEVSSFIPSDIATHNSDGRLTQCNSKGLPAECQEDGYSGGKWSSTSPFNPSNRSISLSGNTTLTLSGKDYWICSLNLSGNSKLIMADGAHVRFFFDTPEHCGTTTQISMSGNNEITATGYQPSLGQFDVPGFYLLGSPTLTSQVNLSGNASTTDEFVIYGPNTNVNISGNATFKGIVAGKSIAMSGNGKLENDSGFLAPPEIVPGVSGTSGSGGEVGETKEEEELRIKEEEEGGQSGSGSHSGKITHTYSAKSYVECTGGAAPAGQAPNGAC